MNVVAGRIGDAAIQLGEDNPVAAPEHLRALPEGSYLFGVRPNHVLMKRRAPSDIEIRTRVELAEISGSETSIHFSHGGSSWVSRQEGVYPLGVDEPISVYIEPKRVFAFNPRGALIAAPDQPTDGWST